MAGTGVYAQVVAAVVSQVVAMRLTLKGVLVPIRIAKKLGASDDQSRVASLRIVAEGRETNERLVGTSRWFEVNVLVGLISAGKLELAGNLSGDLGNYLDWRQTLAETLLDPRSLGLLFVGNARANYKPVLDDQEIEKGLDVSAISFAYRCLLN